MDDELAYMHTDICINLQMVSVLIINFIIPGNHISNTIKYKFFTKYFRKLTTP